jgi:hypothetical protein
MWAKVLKKYGRKWGRIGGFFWGMLYLISASTLFTDRGFCLFF